MSNYNAVTNLRDLVQFGINPLTRESCAYSMRMLCDVNDEGKELIADFLGAPGMQFAENWNSQVGNKPATGSIMLVPEVALPLAQFALFKKGALAVVLSKNTLVGVFEEDLLRAYEANPGMSILRNPSPGTHPYTEGSRNVHAATGRVQ